MLKIKPQSLKPYFDAIDIRLAELMTQLAGGEDNPSLLLAAALLSRFSASRRHICLDLKEVSEHSLMELLRESRGMNESSHPELVTPGYSDWIAALSQSSVVGTPGEYKPLILDDAGRLYFYRYWSYERNLIESISLRLEVSNFARSSRNGEELNRLFKSSHTIPNWQKIAAFTALSGKFCVISGGPGTGKTYTVASIITLLIKEKPDTRISICAPTGKAAARLQESISRSGQLLNRKDCGQEFKRFEATTIHRLLGASGDLTRFRYNRDNPLVTDVLIVDEASMVSLSLMSRLMDALAPETNVVLLGDRNQLSSVEAGSVLGDICDAADINQFSAEMQQRYQQMTGEAISVSPITKGTGNSFALSDHIVELHHSYRFASDSGIGDLSHAINEGDVEQAMAILGDKAQEWVTVSDLPAVQNLKKELQRVVSNHFESAIKAESLERAFDTYNRFRILCSHRLGTYGVAQLNGMVEEILKERGLINRVDRFYQGRLVIIKENDYSVGLFNGDTGLIRKDENGELKVFFKTEEGNFKSITPVRLPRHESAYALTVHESQGSEFDEVVIVLKESASSFLSRELLYTAITRARKGLMLWSDKQVLCQAVTRKVERASGLKDGLKSLSQ